MKVPTQKKSSDLSSKTAQALIAAILPLFSERNVSHDQTMAALGVMKIPLPKSKMIQEIVIRLKLDYTNGGSIPVFTEDQLIAFITKIRVLGNGDQPIRNTTFAE